MAVKGLVRVGAARREQAVRDFKAAPKVLISEELREMAIRRNFRSDVLADTGVSVPLEDIYTGDVVATPEQCAKWVNHLGGHFEVGTRIGVAFAVVDEVVYVAEALRLLTEEQAICYCTEVLFPVLDDRDITGPEFVSVSKTSDAHRYETAVPV